MEEKRLLFVWALLCLFAGHALAQSEPCAFDVVRQQQRESDPSQLIYQRGQASYIQYYRSHKPTWNQQYMPNQSQQSGSGCYPTRFVIPVVVHIDTTGGVITMTNTDVQNQLDIINGVMKDYSIQVCLAQKTPNGTSFNGVTRFGSASIDNRIGNQMPTLTNLVYYDPSRYLNIYVVRTILNSNGTNSTWQGYDNSPPGKGLDGIVMRYNRFGDSATCGCSFISSGSKGLAIVHELGHYLGLYHTFQGGCSAGNTAATCGTAGDLCCDTRPVDTANHTCPVPSPTRSCSYHLSIDENLSNYMDYSGDNCWDNFTPDQTEIMHGTLLGPRSSLVDATNLDSTALACCFKTAWFTAGTTFFCFADRDSIRLSAYQGGATYRWTVRDSTRNRTVLTYSSSSKTFAYLPDSVGRYNITLRVIYASGDSIEMKRSLFIEIADCSTPIASTQGNWYFGEYAGLRFTANGAFRDIEPKKNAPFNINTSEGSISMSNAKGQLLFYGAGDMDIYNVGSMNLYNRYYKPFQTMPVKGDFSSTQGGIALPAPGNGKRYYLFTVSGPDAINYLTPPYPDNRGFRYSIIDTTIIDTSNMATPIYCEVDTPAWKDVPIKASGSALNPQDSALLCGEMITAIPKCNGRDYWVIVLDNSPDTFANYHKLLVFSLDSATGVTFHHTALALNIQASSFGFGQMKASPDGSKLAAPGSLMEFNRITGAITLLDTMVTSNIWACSFSPNSKRLYYLTNIDNNNSVLRQYNLENASDVVMDTIPLWFSNMMQLGPDGKIYISRLSLPQLAVIQHPDEVYSPGNPALVGYTNEGPLLASGGVGGSCAQGLPNFMDAKYPLDIPKQIVHEQNNCFAFQFTHTLCCDTLFKWYFGDGDSAVGKIVNHTFDSLKTYVVRLVTESTTLYDTIRVGIDAPVIAGNVSFICDTTHLYQYTVANNNASFMYNWSVSSPNPLYVDNFGTANVTWKQTGSSIKVIATAPGGCKDSGTVTISIKPIVSNVGIHADQLICSGGTPALLIGDTPTGGYGSYHYQWYSSTDTGTVKTWTKLAADTLQNYQPVPVSQTTWLRREVDPGQCPVSSDPVKITVPSFTNNSIARDTNDCDDVSGSLPQLEQAGLTVSGYAWQRSLNGTSWTTVSGETSQHLQDKVFFDTVYVRRIVYSSGCASGPSNTALVYPFLNTTSYSGDTLCPGDNDLSVGGSGPHCSSHASYSYKWQYRISGMTDFDDLNVSAAANEDFNYHNWTEACYLRRAVISLGDSGYSNIVFVAQRMFENYLGTIGSIPYYTEICRGSNPPSLIGSRPCDVQATGGNWAMQWQSSADTTYGGWDSISGAHSFDYHPTEDSVTMYYRRRAIQFYTNDTLFTPAFTIRVRETTILSQPSNTTETEGDAASFTCQARDLQPIKWQEGRVQSGDTSWSDRSGLFLNPTYTHGFATDYCMNGLLYRALYWNGCGHDTVHSNIVKLTVSHDNWDLWGMDNNSDSGLEPWGGFLWNSPDIWNRKENDNGTAHQNPEYRISAPNYLHVIVRNKGTANSIPAKLYLYWTFASTGERWDRNWRYNLSDPIPARGNWRLYYGNRRAMGDLIGVFNIPAINATGSFQLDTIWYAPDPGIIYGDSSVREAEICFLSRIVTCSDTAFGMTYKETADLGYNVKSNNNIVTKNYIVTDNLPGNQRIHWVGNGNTLDQDATGKLVFKASDCDYYDYGNVLLHLDSMLRSTWSGTGSGFTVVNDSTLKVNPCYDAVLTNIAYGTDAQAWLGVEFTMKEGVNEGDVEIRQYGFTLSQYMEDDTAAVGGVAFAHTMHLGPISEVGKSARTQPKQQYGTASGSVAGNAVGAGDKTGTQAGKQTGKQSSPNIPARKQKQGALNWNVKPNPFSDELQVEYWLPIQAQVQVTLYDVFGQVLKSNVSALREAGRHPEIFQTADLKQAVYYAAISVNGVRMTKKVVLVR